MIKTISIGEPFKLGKCACGCQKYIPLRTKRGYLAKYVNGHSRPKVKYNCGKCKDQNWLVSCKCGCEEILFLRDKFYEVREFIFRHNIRTRDQTGENNPFWKGGRHYNEITEYHFTRRSDHPHQNNGYVANHRLVMEQYLSILMDEEVFIPSEYDVHHIDENKENNSLINLEILEHGDHTIAHNSIDMSDRYCSICGTKETKLRKETGRPEWYDDGQGGVICKKCWFKHYWKKYSKRKKDFGVK
jgi:hypothetical protein